MKEMRRTEWSWCLRGLLSRRKLSIRPCYCISQVKGTTELRLKIRTKKMFCCQSASTVARSSTCHSNMSSPLKLIQSKTSMSSFLFLILATWPFLSTNATLVNLTLLILKTTKSSLMKSLKARNNWLINCRIEMSFTSRKLELFI